MKITPKLKKLLKKTLVQVYSEKKDSLFVLESSLKVNRKIESSGSSTFLTGSNLTQLTHHFCSSVFELKLPAVLRSFQTVQDLSLNLNKYQDKSGFLSLVLVKKNNLVFKNQVYDSLLRFKEEKIVMKIILIKTLVFLILKRSFDKLYTI